MLESDAVWIPYFYRIVAGAAFKEPVSPAIAEKGYQFAIKKGLQRKPADVLKFKPEKVGGSSCCHNTHMHTIFLESISVQLPI